MKPDLLLMGPLMPATMTQLDDAYTVHRYDLAPDKDALIAVLAPHLRAVATRGDYRLERDLLARLPHVKIIASSGTGYQAVYAWIQMMGEKAAWEFMDKLHQNVAVYTHSGSAPCVQAAKGERVIGIGFDMRGAKEKTGGAPIDIILAKEGAPWDMEATAIVKGTKNLAAAQKVADFAVSKPAYELYGKYYAIVGYPGLNPAPPIRRNRAARTPTPAAPAQRLAAPAGSTRAAGGGDAAAPARASAA